MAWTLDQGVHAISFKAVMSPKKSFLTRHGTKLILASVILGIAGLNYAETPYNAAIYWALRWVTGPVILLTILYVYVQKEALLTQYKSWVRVVMITIALMLAGLIMGAGAANVVNTWVKEPKQTTLQGLVVDKLESSSPLGGGKQVRIQNPDTGKITSVVVSSGEYETLIPGSIYRRSMNEGLLGFPFLRR